MFITLLYSFSTTISEFPVAGGWQFCRLSTFDTWTLQTKASRFLGKYKFLHVCYVTIYKVEPLNKNIAVSLPGNQYFRKWPCPNFKVQSRDSEQAGTADQVVAVSFACDWYFPRNPLASDLSIKIPITAKVTPRNWGKSIFSDHAHFSYVCHVIICTVVPLNKNIAVSLPGNQYYRKWRLAGSDHARLLSFCHVILIKQTPLTTYIAVSFPCHW